MALTNMITYKTRPAMRSDDTRITSPKPLDDAAMPLSPVPFISSSGLVTFQHDLKARIASSPLVKVPLTMRPLIKKRTSIPFTLSLKRHSTTIFSRSSSSSSDTSDSAGCTPTLELEDPLSTGVSFHSQSETPIHIPLIGAKIMDRFWPEEEESYSEENCHISVPSRYPAALTPPPHHRRAPRSLGSIRDVPVCPRSSDEQGSGPLRFPF